MASEHKLGDRGNDDAQKWFCCDFKMWKWLCGYCYYHLKHVFLCMVHYLTLWTLIVRCLLYFAQNPDKEDDEASGKEEEEAGQSGCIQTSVSNDVPLSNEEPAALVQ